MSVNTVGSFLNIRDSHLRVVSGNVYATAMNIGGINVDVAQGLQSVTNQGNVTSNTLQFSNATTAFVTTGNVSVGRDLTVTGNTLVSSNLTVTGNVLVSDDLTVTGNVAMDTDTLFVNATTSNVGIGTVTPGYTLDVAGDINFSGTFNQNGAPFVSSPWTKTGADLSYTTGNVSVGKDLTVTGFVGNSGTGAILVPSGTTAQQPAGVNGMLRYNTETGYMEAYTVSGWSVIATPPSITSFDITNVAVAAVDTDTITVSGSGFDAITNIQLRGADGKNYDTTTFTFTNSGSIGFKIGTLALGQLANRPYKVVVTNGAGLSATSSTTLGLGGVTWSSPAASSINDFPIGVSTSLTLSAYDGGGGSAVTYTLQSGSYLSGTFTLSGSTITGTTNAAENTTSSVTIRATDNADSSVFLDRTFTLKAVPPELYPFTSHTFIPPPHINISSMSSEPASWGGYTDRRHVIAASGTWNAYTLDGIVSGGTHLGGFTTITDNGVTRSPTATEYNQGAGTWGYKLWVHWDGTTHQVLGLMRGRDGDVRFGPTFAQLKSNYGASGWWQTPANLNEVSGKQGFQLWTVPTTGTYRITAKGAQGGSTAGNGTYSNSPGNGAHISADIALVKGTKIVIIVGQSGEYPVGSSRDNTGAGGGGATWILKENFTTANDQVYMVAGGGGGASRPYSNNGTSGSANGSSQGILGGGGNSFGAGGGTASNRASGGAGWTGDGSADSNSDSSGGLRPANGAAGGAAATGSGTYVAYTSLGGFGGGGGNGVNTAGGGAGASGGNAATDHSGSGALSTGGTSYIITTATNPTFSGNHTDEDGSVYIQAPGQF